MQTNRYERVVERARLNTLLSPDVAMTDIVCVRPDATLREAAELMRGNHIGDVIVAEKMGPRQYRPIGILTDRDLAIEILGQGINGETLLVRDIMTDSLVTAGWRDDVFTLARTMRENGVGRLPVVDENGALVGILTSRKLCQLFLQGLTDLAGLTVQQQSNERILRH